jgi:hypothetical protein
MVQRVMHEARAPESPIRTTWISGVIANATVSADSAKAAGRTHARVRGLSRRWPSRIPRPDGGRSLVAIPLAAPGHQHQRAGSDEQETGERQELVTEVGVGRDQRVPRSPVGGSPNGWR